MACIFHCGFFLKTRASVILADLPYILIEVRYIIKPQMKSIQIKSPEIVISIVSTGLIGLYLLLFSQESTSTLFLILFLSPVLVGILFFPKSGIFTILLSIIAWGEKFGGDGINFVSRIDFKIYLLDILLCATLFSCLLGGVFKKTIQWRTSFVDKAILLFVVVGLVAAARGIFTFQNDLNVVFGGLRNHLYALVYFLVFQMLKTREDLAGAKTIIYVGTAVGLLFLAIGLISGEGIWTEKTPLTTSGIRYISSVHALYISTGIILLLASFQEKVSDLPILKYILFPLWVAALLFSLVRNLWISTIFGLIFILLFTPNLGRKRLFQFLLETTLFIVVPTALFFLLKGALTGNLNFISSFFERISSYSNPEGDISISWRLNSWSEGWNAFKGQILLGRGLGTVIFPYYEVFWTRIPTQAAALHNSYLTILVQLGLIGLTSFLSILTTFFIESIKIIKKYGVDHPKESGFLVGIGAYIFAYCYGAFFSLYFELNFLIVAFWIIFGLGVSALSMLDQKMTNSNSGSDLGVDI
ncbi:hypothetical protein CO015_02805 [candidate division WWE3 bacterium CG_4_8_14_3_um_filter_42_11]|uniref:O-antigen ligase-related domain-containing protein n=1 Tax=candidate division WWE3 bacterium CG_4_8_14_3_um_filter_42_11 TaxID=1975076 RepID=A0A2M8G6V8_UNCKA|nr:MAG: hypothetical protein CO015_02805 [candidate division WWE3 bacterium CG_4_8_14_3_um_filter_42_11]